MFFFFKQKTAYEMRISDWSSDVCSSDLIGGRTFGEKAGFAMLQEDHKRRVARLIRGERKVADLHNLFSDLRMHQPGRATVQEIGHFAAHRHERDKGISLTRANDILPSARLWHQQFNLTKLTTDHLKR